MRSPSVPARTLELRTERTNINQMECITGLLMMSVFNTGGMDYLNPHAPKDEVKEIRVSMGGKTVSQPKWMTC